MPNKFSIITIIFEPNLEDLLNNLYSVHNQIYQNIEHIIQDGSTSDNAKLVIEKFMKNNFNHKIQYYKEKDDGIYDALNKAIEKCENEVIGLLHSDDLFSNESVISLINDNFSKNTDLIYGDLIYINKENKIVRNWKSGAFYRKNLSFGWMPPHPTIFLKKKIINKFGNYDSSYKIAGDYDFILRIFKNDIKIRYIPKIITKMKIGGTSNKSLRNLLIKSKEDLRALKTNKIGGIFSLFFKNIRKIGQFF